MNAMNERKAKRMHREIMFDIAKSGDPKRAKMVHDGLLQANPAIQAYPNPLTGLELVSHRPGNLKCCA